MIIPDNIRAQIWAGLMLEQLLLNIENFGAIRGYSHEKDPQDIGKGLVFNPVDDFVLRIMFSFQRASALPTLTAVRAYKMLQEKNAPTSQVPRLAAESIREMQAQVESEYEAYFLKRVATILSEQPSENPTRSEAAAVSARAAFVLATRKERYPVTIFLDGEHVNVLSRVCCFVKRLLSRKPNLGIDPQTLEPSI